MQIPKAYNHNSFELSDFYFKLYSSLTQSLASSDITSQKKKESPVSPKCILGTTKKDTLDQSLKLWETEDTYVGHN